VSVVGVRARPLPSIAGVWSVDDGDARIPAESRRKFRAVTDDCNSSPASVTGTTVDVLALGAKPSAGSPAVRALRGPAPVEP
jgi:hypothetical protein